MVAFTNKITIGLYKNEIMYYTFSNSRYLNSNLL